MACGDCSHVASNVDKKAILPLKEMVCWLNRTNIPKEARVLQGLQSLLPVNWGAGNNYIYGHSKAEDEIVGFTKQTVRVFQLVGFSRGGDDVDLAFLMLDMAVQLQTFMPSTFWSITKDMACVSRIRATKLEWFVPWKVKDVNCYNKHLQWCGSYVESFVFSQ